MQLKTEILTLAILMLFLYWRLDMIDIHRRIKHGVTCAICLLLAMSVSTAYATIYSYIVNTTPIDPSNCGRGVQECVKYNYVISSWTSNADKQPNPCRDDSRCFIFVGHRHNAAGTSGESRDDAFSPIYISGMKTIGDVRKAVLSAHSLPLRGVVQHGGDVLTNECVGFFAGHVDTSNTVAGLPMFPQSICGVAPPPTGHCKFDSQNIILNYGSVTSENLNGKQVSATVTVSCDANIKIEAWLINPQDGSDIVPLRKDGSLSAKLLLDGESASAAGKKTYSVKAGGSVPLTVTSEAVVSGTPESGEFSGSAVLFLAIP